MEGARNMTPRASNLVIWLASAIAVSTTVALDAQDSVQLKDGRFVMDKKMTRDVKGVTVHYENGEIFIPAEKILSTTALDASGKGMAVSAADQEKLDKGFVRFQKRWVKKSIRDREIAKLRKKREKMIVDAKAHQEWGNRHIKQTRNFQFEFTLDPAVMQNYMDLMETYYKVFTKEWKHQKARGNRKRLPVCFYHNEEYFHQVGGVHRRACSATSASSAPIDLQLLLRPPRRRN